MKIVLVRENDVIRIPESGGGFISEKVMSMRKRLTGGDIRYYILDYDESIESCPLAGYIAALNMYPDLLDESDLIKEIL